MSSDQAVLNVIFFQIIPAFSNKAYNIGFLFLSESLL